MKKFLSNIDNIIDDFEFQDVRFINNQFLKTMNLFTDLPLVFM